MFDKNGHIKKRAYEKSYVFKFDKIKKGGKMRNTIKHKTYTIEEKNKIVKEYLNGEMGYKKITRYYDLPSSATLCYWKKQYLLNGSVMDNRGKSGTGKGNFERKKRLIPEEMSHEELVEYVKAVEDIKKSMVFLRQQKKNIK